MGHDQAGTDQCTRTNRPGHARWTGSRLERDDELRACVLERLSWGWSPEQIAGHLAEAAGRTVISYESIYRFIDAQAAWHKNHAWRRYLPRAKWKRGRRRRKGSSSASFIAHRRPVAERPAAAADRQTFGHWEADTMLFGRSGEVVLALHERLSRLVLMARVPSKAAGPIAETIARVLGPLPPAFRQTVTFDNGTEFARHPRAPRPRHRDLLLRHLLAVAEGGSRERHRPAASLPAPEDEPSGGAGGAVYRKWRWRTTIRRVSASATDRRPRYSRPECCTSNVNSPSAFAGMTDNAAYGFGAAVILDGGLSRGFTVKVENKCSRPGGPSRGEPGAKARSG